MYRLMILVPVLLLLLSCKQEDRKITNVEDYEKFLGIIQERACK